MNDESVSALDGFADAELRGSELAWNNKSQEEMMKAKPTTHRLIASSGSGASYDFFYVTTSSDGSNVCEPQADPYADYDRAMGILRP